MGVVKAKTSSSGTDALFRGHSRTEGKTSLSEWRNALARLHDASKERVSWFDIGGSTYLETEDAIGFLNPDYTLNREEEIRSWLERHPRVKELLFELPTVVEEYFPAADLRLDVRVDPETSADERLGVYIQTELDPAEAVKRLTDLDAAWGDRVQSLSDGNVFINVEAKS